MKVKTYRAATIKAALEQVKKDLGSDAFILSQKEVRPGKLMGVIRRNYVEVTAAVDYAGAAESKAPEVHVRSQSLRAISAAVLVLAATAAAEPRLLAQHAVRRPIDGRPDALVDLRTADGVRLVNGQWRYSDTKIIETDFNAPGADLRPSGKPINRSNVC